MKDSSDISAIAESGGTKSAEVPCQEEVATPVTTSTVRKRKKHRHASSTTPLTIKPHLTESQQLALAMQLSSPVASPGALIEGISPKETPSLPSRGRMSKRNERGEAYVS